MARIRTIKPSIWADQKFISLSREERLLVIGLISQADDAGRFIAIPVTLSGNLYPLDNIAPAKIKKWRDQIAKTGLIKIYTVDGIEFGYFPNWSKHQRIDRPQPSTIPDPRKANSANRSSNLTSKRSPNESPNRSTTHSDTDREVDLDLDLRSSLVDPPSSVPRAENRGTSTENRKTDEAALAAIMAEARQRGIA